MSGVSEATVEDATLNWLEEIGWSTAYGPDIAPDADAAERGDYAEGFLVRRLQSAIERLNPDLPLAAQGSAYRALTRPEGAILELRNRTFHQVLVEGIAVEYQAAGGRVRGAQAQSWTSTILPTTTGWRSINSQ